MLQSGGQPPPLPHLHVECVVPVQIKLGHGVHHDLKARDPGGKFRRQLDRSCRGGLTSQQAKHTLSSLARKLKCDACAQGVGAHVQGLIPPDNLKGEADCPCGDNPYRPPAPVPPPSFLPTSSTQPSPSGTHLATKPSPLPFPPPHTHLLQLRTSV